MVKSPFFGTRYPILTKQMEETCDTQYDCTTSEGDLIGSFQRKAGMLSNPDDLLLETDLTTLLITMCEMTCWYVKMFGYLDLPQCLVRWSFWRFTKQGSEVLQPLYFSVFSRPTFYFR